MIKNIVFDVGNVLVKWDPLAILNTTFPGQTNHDFLRQEIFKHQTWLDLNLGHITDEQAVDLYCTRLEISVPDMQRLLQNTKHSLTPIPGMIELLKSLHAANYPIYALTDNVHSIVEYLKQQYDFWPLFRGVVVSAEVKYLKPAPQIYQHLLSTYQLAPNETVFIDDLPRNIEGAVAQGMAGIQFEDVGQCEAALKGMGIKW